MGKYNFDEIHDRHNTSCIKWDFGKERMNRDDLLPLWVADMDFKLPDEVLEDIHKRVDHGIFGYTDPKDDYIDALNKWFRERHGFEIKKEWNVAEPGVVVSLANAVKAFAKEGEAVLVQQPVYYPFTGAIEYNKRKVVNNELVYKDGHYEIDFEDFEKKIVEENVKLFLLCNPHNPVGRVWTKDELLKMADICYKHNVYVFSDEIHFDFVFKGFKHTSFITLGEKYLDKLILGTAPSKTFNIAGLQNANIIIPNKEVRDRYRYVNDAAGLSQISVIGLEAAKSVYTKGGPWFDELLEYIEGNLSYVRSFLKEKLPEVKLVEPEGTYLIWLDFSGVTSDYKELEDLIVNKAKLWLDGGKIIGRKSALFERINIATPRKYVEQAMEQLYNAVKAYKN